MIGLFRRKERSPDETCPRCGGSKSATMALCTTCAIRDSGSSTGRGLPGERAWREEPRAGAPAPHAPPSTPPGQVPAPIPPSLDRGPAPQQAAPQEHAGYALRAKQGVWVRTPEEAECADLLYDNRIVFAYETKVDRHAPAFLIPEKQVVIDRSEGWEAKERHASLEALGYKVVPLPDRDVKARLRTALGPYFAGRSWKL